MALGDESSAISAFQFHLYDREHSCRAFYEAGGGTAYSGLAR